MKHWVVGKRAGLAGTSGFGGRVILTSQAERNAGETSACDPRCCNCFPEELSFITRTIPAYYVAGPGKMLEISFLSKNSFLLDCHSFLTQHLNSKILGK